MSKDKEDEVRINNLVAKHSPHRAATHRDRKRASKRVRGQKHRSRED